MSDMMLKTLTAMDAVILPTPNAVEAEKYTKTYNKDSQMGRSLTAMAVNGLLPTPLAKDENGGVRTLKGERKKRPGLLKISDMASLNLLPTPLAVSVRHPGRVSELRIAGDVTFCSRAVGETRPNGLEDWLQFHGLMPMRAEDFEAMFPENGGSPGSKDGRASQLNPLFVGEMMGYPLEWLTSPFLSGDGEGRP